MTNERTEDMTEDFYSGIWYGAFIVIAMLGIILCVIWSTTSPTFDGNVTRTITIKQQYENDVDKLKLIPQMVDIVTNANMNVTSIVDEIEDSKKIVVVKGVNNDAKR